MVLSEDILKRYGWEVSRRSSINKLDNKVTYRNGKLKCDVVDGELKFYVMGDMDTIQFYPTKGDHLISMDEMINNRLVL